MKRLLALAIFLFMVPNVLGLNSNIVRNEDHIELHCNISNFSTQGYQYTLYKDGVNTTSGFAYTRGDTEVLLWSPYVYNVSLDNWDPAQPVSNYFDNDTTTYAITTGGNSVVNITYRIPFYPNINYVYWNTTTGFKNIGSNLSNWSKGEYFYINVYDYVVLGNPKRAIMRPLNLSSRTYDELIDDTSVNVASAQLYEENYTINYNISTYEKGVDKIILNHTINKSIVENYVLGCRAINLNTINGTSSVWYNSSSFSISSNITINISDEITLELITQNISFEATNTHTGFSYKTSTVTGELNLSTLLNNDAWVFKFQTEGYYPREYYYTSSSSSVSIELFLLNGSGDQVIHTVFDEFGDGAINSTIHLLREYGADYITVSMSRTNFGGKTVLSAELYDVNYRMIYYKPDGTLIRITTPAPFLLTLTDDQVVLGNDAYYSWRAIDGVYTNVTIFNNSGTITARFIYTDPAGVLRDGCLNVKRLTTAGVFSVCNNCTSSASAVLTCIIDHTIEGEYQAYGMIDTNSTNSWYNAGMVTWVRSFPFRFGQEGIWLSFMIIGTMALLGVSTITGSVVLLILGLVIPLTMSFIAGFSFGIIAWLAILGLVILYLVRKVKR